MKYILDTNVLIWFTEKNKLLPKQIAAKILNENNELFISIASLWEITIKVSLEKLSFSLPLERFFDDIVNEYKFNLLPITEQHLLKLSEIPFHHKDPFDRLIFAQSKVENIELLYTDAIFDSYKV